MGKPIFWGDYSVRRQVQSFQPPRQIDDFVPDA